MVVTNYLLHSNVIVIKQVSNPNLFYRRQSNRYIANMYLIFQVGLLAHLIISLLKNPAEWWKSWKDFKDTKDLALFAIRILSIPPTSASIERNFSLQSLIDTKRRGGIRHVRIEKLMTVKSYLDAEIEPDSGAEENEEEIDSDN